MHYQRCVSFWVFQKEKGSEKIPEPESYENKLKRLHFPVNLISSLSFCLRDSQNIFCLTFTFGTHNGILQRAIQLQSCFFSKAPESITPSASKMLTFLQPSNGSYVIAFYIITTYVRSVNTNLPYFFVFFIFF